MRGSVVRKGARYFVKFELDPDPLTGKRRQKWHSGFNTKREAEKARVDLLSKFDRGEFVEPTQQTLADYLTEWLKAIEHTVRPQRLVRERNCPTVGGPRIDLALVTADVR